ncbi:pyruvate carboxylase subunit B [Methylomarinovum caldicuralii]|uniref:Pyruvate carboxylase subunit B n=1 Tax=Methylomarinovum caldicuralii TaxID=438856 RepID=A0AAU9BUZ8_9GAMM|nr:sodium-extruding oxaloacetate decarboxylase subunit alpha [Methylomarinovum caldicuralii]BCX82803.1 pyruvate carboxylase subunit B [Methylomarinovum caldicuralii]
MNRVQITELALRDAHQCLLATRVRTEDMLPICPQLDRVGFWSLECWGGATFDACLRYLKEDPWERLRQLRQALPDTRLQMLLRGQNLLGYRHYADDVVEAFVDRAAANGMDVFRLFDALNDLRNLETAVAAVKRAGKHAQGALCYTVSPVHSVEGFVAQARELARMGCDSIAIKDMSGLLTPAVTARLVRDIKAAVDLPLHLHSHATSGLAAMCHLKAVESGIDHIDTAISSLAGGPSHPPTESLAVALRDLGRDPGYDLALLEEIAAYFWSVRQKYRRFEPEYVGPDPRVHIHQVPGGMISNLYNQLKEQGSLDRLKDVLAEIPRVRKDLGYPPLVTPTSQIVGTQAVINVLAGERYQTITNEVRRYLQGGYGKPPGPVNEELRRRAVGNEEIIECRPADLIPPELETLRREIGELARSEEDMLTYALFPDVGRQFLTQRAQGTLEPEPIEPPAETAARAAPTEFNVHLHGETYHVRVTGAGPRQQAERHFYLVVDGVPEEAVIETLDEVVLGGGTEGAVPRRLSSKRPKAAGEGDVTLSMPGNIVEVLVKEGDTVQAGDPVLIVETMKMETEVQAPIGGTVTAVYVQKGDAVTPTETLLHIEP